MATSLLLPSSMTAILAWSAAAYLVSLAFNRYFFSPLARFPGPKLAALTSWYECYYGPIVRIGPNDVSISDPDFVDTIYAPGPGRKRDKDYEKNKALGVNSSVGGSINHELHRKRREALNPFFSHQRISRLNTELMEKAVQINSIFAKARECGEVLNLSDAYFGFANDIVHEYCFGNKPNLLGDLNLANTRRTNLAVVLQSVKVKLHFGWIFDTLQMLPASISARMLPPGVKDMIAFRMDIRTQINQLLAKRKEPSIMAKENMFESIFTHLHDSPELPRAEKSAQRLEDEATLMTMAGTYSPMVSLATAHYHLLARPDIMSKLRAELASNPSAVSATQLEKLPYLSAVIQEAHRLTFGLTGRNPRVCPDETLVYTQRASESDNYKEHTYKIPPGTSISTSTLLVHTNESVFQDPWRFDPERWLVTDHATLARRRRCMLGFMRGPRSCIGIHLANAEMALLVATMARWDMQLFETMEQDVSFCHDYHVLCPRLGSKGVRVRVLGRLSNEE